MLPACLAIPPNNLFADKTTIQVEKLFDIIVSALDISASINPSLGGSNFAASSLCQGLAGDYMLLLTSLRGGNHPFLERYRAYLGSLASASASSSAVGAGWGQQ